MNAHSNITAEVVAEPIIFDEVEVTADNVVAIVTEKPVAALSGKELFELYVEALKKDIMSYIPDLSTDKGRKAIVSFAYSFTREKTRLVAIAKEEKAGHQNAIKALNTAIEFIEAEMADLSALARTPLTEWEEKEAARAKLVTDTIIDIQNMAIISANLTIEQLATRGQYLADLNIDPEVFKDKYDNAVAEVRRSLGIVDAARERLVTAEEERKAADAARIVLEARLTQEAADRQALEEKALAAEKARDEMMAKMAEMQAQLDALRNPPAPTVEPLAVEAEVAAEVHCVPVGDRAEAPPVAGTTSGPIRLGAMKPPVTVAAPTPAPAVNDIATQDANLAAYSALLDVLEAGGIANAERVAESLLDAIQSGDIPHIKFTL